MAYMYRMLAQFINEMRNAGKRFFNRRTFYLFFHVDDERKHRAHYSRAINEMKSQGVIRRHGKTSYEIEK